MVIITYNYARFIGQAIESVLAQKIEDMEIIVIDDGSTDPTPEAVAPYADRIIYRHQENAGQSAARNAGLAIATGEFIQFLDSDDLLGPDKIATQIEWLRRHQANSVAVSPTRLFTRVDQWGRPVTTGSWHLFADCLDVHLCFTNIAPPHAFLFRREALAGAAPFDSIVDNCEDYDLLLRAAVCGDVPVHVPGCAVYYRKHGQSVTARAQRQYQADAVMCYRLAALLAVHPNFPGNHRIPGRIAFAAGALQTAVRLARTRPQLAVDLVALATAKISDAASWVRERPIAVGYPLVLYCLKTALALSDPRLVAISGSAALRRRFVDLLCQFDLRAMIAASVKGLFRALAKLNPEAIREYLYLLSLFARLLFGDLGRARR